MTSMFTNMYVNSSSAQFYPNSSINVFLKCFSSSSNIYILSAFFIITILILPVLILVLYLGYQQWRKQRSVPTTTISHTDCLTYHSVIMQLIGFLGFIILFCSICFNIPKMMLVGFGASITTALGQALVYLLMCVVHYLAVVHPITYLDLKKTGGVKIGNISVGCIWLFCTCVTVVYVFSSMYSMIMFLCLMAFILIVISFCCISVLCALKRPGPGEVVGDRERVDQSKQRAFNTIMVIMGVLGFRFLGNLICNVIYGIRLLSPSVNCVLLVSVMWFDLPCSLMLPLLFLHRAGKLQCCKQNTEAG